MKGKWVWELTEEPLGVLEYIELNGWKLSDVSWWIEWEINWERGTRAYKGWGQLEDVDERVYRQGVVMSYQQYRGWYTREVSTPGWVSDNSIKAEQ